jgi:DNA polymerase-3 subunit epsilon
MDFYAIDVETADYDSASICQIGIAGYANKTLAFAWESLIKPDPRFRFAPTNSSIHGITASMVKDAPSLPEVYPLLRETLENAIVVSHTRFDTIAMSRAFAAHQLREFPCAWLDSALIARRAWRQFSRRGFNLKNVCSFLNYEFQHHDALEDAKAAGCIVLRACEATGLGLGDWLSGARPTAR